MGHVSNVKLPHVQHLTVAIIFGNFANVYV